MTYKSVLHKSISESSILEAFKYDKVKFRKYFFLVDLEIKILESYIGKAMIYPESDCAKDLEELTNSHSKASRLKRIATGVSVV